MPGRIVHQLATLVGEPPAGEAWLHEVKLDGYRLALRVQDRSVELWTRGGKQWSARFPDIVRAAAALQGHTAILDGEAVILDAQGRSSFGALQQAIDRPNRALFFYAFDLLYLDGYDLRPAPLIERKQVLQELLEAVRSQGHDVIRYSGHVVGNGAAFFQAACQVGAEGIVSKRADAAYEGGRSRSWLKSKCVQRQEFLIVGFTDPGGSRVGFGALLLAFYDSSGALVFAGKVGTGFNARTLRDLHARLREREVDGALVRTRMTRGELRGVHWVRPELVCEVAFTEWTREGELRHPSFQGLREDKAAREVVRERPV